MTSTPPRQTSVLLDRISAGGTDSTRAIAEISEIAAAEGLSHAEFSSIFNLIFESTLTTTQRLAIIRRCLVPKPTFLLDSSLLNRVLSVLGTPEIYYKNGKQHKLKRWAIGCQQMLLEWLICALPLFGRGIFRYLRRCLPLLLTLLLYEFLRPYVAVLIIVSAHAADAFLPPSSRRSPIRYWHVKYVADLAQRFPLDQALLMLLAFFRLNNRELDYSTIFSRGQAPRLAQTFEMVTYPNEEIRRLLLVTRWNPDDPISLQVKLVEEHLQRVFSYFQLQSAKRKRTSTDPLVFDALESLNTVSIGSIDSVSALATHFEEINLTNASSVLSVAVLPNEHFRAMYLALLLLKRDPSYPTIKKLLYAIKYHVLTLEPRAALGFSQLLRFGLYGGLHGLQSPIVEFVCTSGDGKPPWELVHLVKRQIQLLEYVSEAVVRCFTAVLHNIEKAIGSIEVGQQSASELAMHFFFVLGRCIRQWAKHSELFVPTALPEILRAVFSLAQSHWINFSLSAQLAFLDVLRALKKLDWPGSALVPPPVFVYQLMVSTNPYVMSEMLGYIAFLKTVDLPEPALQLRNSYVVDAINFLWKDAALKSEPNTLNWGMLLHPSYVEKVAAHNNYFSYSNLIQLRTVGGLAQNPSLAYMCAELMWQLEDLHPEISTRHPGPLAEETVKLLHQDLEVTWLPMSYDQIRISLLNSLDQRGFSGMCDLLFLSLKLLAGKREKEHEHGRAGEVEEK